MMRHLQTITINGFKSIRALDRFEIHGLNILIGGNGAGKSNFAQLFSMLRAMANQRLDEFDDPAEPDDGADDDEAEPAEIECEQVEALAETAVAKLADTREDASRKSRTFVKRVLSA